LSNIEHELSTMSTTSVFVGIVNRSWLRPVVLPVPVTGV
jgi:hypothetical protein